MKTLITTLALSLSSLLTAQDSVVDYFAANPRWVETYVGPDGSENPVDVQLYLEGDSTLGGKTYHKLMSKRNEAISFFDNRVGTHLQGLIRQEGRKIYYRGFILNQVPYNGSNPITASSPLPREEVLLYDFGLEVGDSINMKENPLYYDYISRFPEDTVFVVTHRDNSYYKLYPNDFIYAIGIDTKNNGNLGVLEGIGAFNFFLGSGASNFVTFISCYKNDSTDFLETTAQPWQGNTGCDFATSIVNREFTAKLKLYPQPSQGKLYVSNASLKNYTIYNSQGKQVLSNTQANGATQINLSHLANGLYFLHYSTSQGQQGVEKIILNSY